MARRPTPALDPAADPAPPVDPATAPDKPKRGAKKDPGAPTAAKRTESNGVAVNGAAASNGEIKHRKNHGRNWLAEAIEDVLRKAEKGQKGYEFPMPVGVIRTFITNPDGELPSTGAVSAAVLRWADGGYIKIKRERPLSVVGFTAKYSAEKGGSLTKFSDDTKANRAKTKASASA